MMGRNHIEYIRLSLAQSSTIHNLGRYFLIPAAPDNGASATVLDSKGYFACSTQQCKGAHISLQPSFCQSLRVVVSFGPALPTNEQHTNIAAPKHTF
jgi:hypothetical protein